MEAICITFGVMLLLFLMTVPVGVSITLATMVGLYLSDMPLAMTIQRFFSLFDSFPLMAIPFFVLSGDLMQRGSMADDLLGMCRAWVGHWTGGLAMISILTCLFYAALCGSALATTAAVGSMLVPAMLKEGYDRNFSAACSTVGGTLGPMIPPSIPLILMGSFGNLSVPDLFLATIIPGCIVAGCFMIAAQYVVRKQGYGVTRPKPPLRERLRATARAKYALGVPAIILGGIYGGIATPTEAGAAAVIYAIVVECFVTRNLNLTELKAALYNSLITLGVIMIVMLAANALGILVQYHNVTGMLTDLVRSMNISSGLGLFFLLSGVLLVLGCFMEGTALIIILTPILVPLAINFGINPIHFCIFFLVFINIGLYTPPVGTNLYVGARVADATLPGVSKAIVPFLILNLIAALLIIFVPAISLCLL
ncbi:TRAP transporter large permease [Desulfovibrio sp. OttesenSCG-928-C14]|nr:TRAP transporter large permease [Desulfovibrio sp. OttesenSCG-928-C14]